MYRFNYKESKHTEDIIEYMERYDINPESMTEEERNDIIRNRFGVFSKESISYFEKI